MRLNKLSEGILDEVNTIEQIMEALSGKVLIVFSVKATTIGTDEPHSQITNIAAVAIDAESGNDIDVFNGEAALNLITLRQIDLQDRRTAAGKWPDGELSVRDMLNVSDYDLDEYDEEEEVDKPSDMEVALEFKAFVDEYAGRAILITYNAEFALKHLNDTLPVPIKNDIIDNSKFTKLYFEPVLRTMMIHGSKRANDMAEKLWDEFNKFRPTLPNLGRALGVKKRSWAGASTLVEVQQLANIFMHVLKFLQKQYKVFHDDEFKNLAARALERIRAPSETYSPASQENQPSSDS